MVVAVDYARARPHPGHVRPSPSRQWLAAAAPRPSLAAPRPRPAAPRQPRLGHEKNGRTEAAPTWPRKKWSCGAPAWPRKKMDLREFEPTTLLFEDG
jgi:hypothetical protein